MNTQVLQRCGEGSASHLICPGSLDFITLTNTGSDIHAHALTHTHTHTHTHIRTHTHAHSREIDRILHTYGT